MSTQKQKVIRRKTSSEVKEMELLFYRFCNPLPDSPSDEYESIIHQVVSCLHSGKQQSDIMKLIERGFRDQYEITVPSKQIENVSKEIIQWWRKRSNAA